MVEVSDDTLNNELTSNSGSQLADNSTSYPFYVNLTFKRNRFVIPDSQLATLYYHDFKHAKTGEAMRVVWFLLDKSINPEMLSLSLDLVEERVINGQIIQDNLLEVHSWTLEPPISPPTGSVRSIPHLTIEEFRDWLEYNLEECPALFQKYYWKQSVHSESIGHRDHSFDDSFASVSTYEIPSPDPLIGSAIASFTRPCLPNLLRQIHSDPSSVSQEMITALGKDLIMKGWSMNQVHSLVNQLVRLTNHPLPNTNLFTRLVAPPSCTQLRRLGLCLGSQCKRFQQVYSFPQPPSLELEDLVEYLRIPVKKDERPKWDITYLPDRIARRLIDLNHICRTEFGLYTFTNEIFEQGTWPIKNLLNTAYGDGSTVDLKCRKLNFPPHFLPQVRLSTGLVNQVVDNIESKLGLVSTYFQFNFISFFDPGYCLAFNNGLYDFDREALRPFDVTQGLTNKLASDYVHPFLDSSVNQIYEDFCQYARSLVDTDEEYISLQEAMGSLLPFQRLFKKDIIIKGPRDSGKSTFINIIKKIIGEQNYVSVTFHKLLNDRFWTASLRMKSVNFCGDLKRAKIEDLGEWKAISGSDAIPTEDKGIKGDSNTRLFCKFVILTNELPRSEELFEADVLTRLFIIYFKRVISKPLPPGEIERKYSTPEAISAIAYWMLEGLKRLRSQRDWSYPQDVESVRQMLEKDLPDVMFPLLCEFADDAKHNYYELDSRDLYNAYVEYASAFGLNTKTSNAFLRIFHRWIKRYNEGVDPHYQITKTRPKDLTQKPPVNYYLYKNIRLNQQYIDKIHTMKERESGVEGALSKHLQPKIEVKKVSDEVPQILEDFVRKLLTESPKITYSEVMAKVVQTRFNTPDGMISFEPSQGHLAYRKVRQLDQQNMSRFQTKIAQFMLELSDDQGCVNRENLTSKLMEEGFPSPMIHEYLEDLLYNGFLIEPRPNSLKQML